MFLNVEKGIGEFIMWNLSSIFFTAACSPSIFFINTL
jgi:hypothetical protein